MSNLSYNKEELEKNRIMLIKSVSECLKKLQENPSENMEILEHRIRDSFIIADFVLSTLKELPKDRYLKITMEEIEKYRVLFNNYQNLKVRIDENLNFFESFLRESPVLAGYYSKRKGIVTIEHFEVLDPNLKNKGIGTVSYCKIREYFKKENIKKIEIFSCCPDAFGEKTAYDFWVNHLNFKESEETIGLLVDKIQ